MHVCNYCGDAHARIICPVSKAANTNSKRYLTTQHSNLPSPSPSHTLAAEIKSLLQKQAIEVVHGPDQLNVFFFRYFLIPKKDGGIRPILDLRDLNVFLKRLPFHILRVADVIRAVNRNNWFITIDLRDAYYHIPIVTHHRRFLRFHVKGVTPIQSSSFRLSPGTQNFYRMCASCTVFLWHSG